MSNIMLASVVLAGISTILGAILTAVYFRNHREIRSPFTLGLLLFAVFLVVHNAIVVYHFITMMPMFAFVDESLILAENILQVTAISILLTATLR